MGRDCRRLALAGAMESVVLRVPRRQGARQRVASLFPGEQQALLLQAVARLVLTGQAGPGVELRDGS